MSDGGSINKIFLSLHNVKIESFKIRSFIMAPQKALIVCTSAEKYSTVDKATGKKIYVNIFFVSDQVIFFIFEDYG